MAEHNSDIISYYDYYYSNNNRIKSNSNNNTATNTTKRKNQDNNNNNTNITSSTNQDNGNDYDYDDDDNNPEGNNKNKNINKNIDINKKNNNDTTNSATSTIGSNSTTTTTTTTSTTSSKRVIIGGIPGVGKTSVISTAVKALNEKGENAKVVVFGTEMFEEAKRTAGIKNRDELRKLSVEDQKRLQEMAARRIAKMQDRIVIVDTHIFVRTGDGYYYPGLPMRLLDIIKPTGFVMIAAEAAEIVNRRKNDTTRNRDAVSEQQVQYELDISKLMVATCSILTGAPFIIIANNDNKMDDASYRVVKVLSAK